MAEQTGGQGRQQPNSYPSPHSYPSPSMQPTYTYPPPQGQPTSEPYRGSPTASHTSLPSLNLPPIRSIDGQPQGQPPPHHVQPPMGSPLPPPVAPMSAYYPPPGSLPPPGHPMHVTSSPHNMHMRYPQMPPQGVDQRVMSGGRHKKEIKRRTKTGCLTCRKRRIKCDEAHPVCRNCQKSKRECLGYDPIFKPQPGPPQIQPAPSAPPSSGSTPATAPPPPTASYPNVPHGYTPAVSAGYAPGAPAASAPYDFGAIDPALAGGDPSNMPQAPYENAHLARAGLKGPVGSASPYSSAASDAQPRKVKRDLNIEDLLVIGNIPPQPTPPQDGPVSPSLLEEIKTMYTNVYAAGIDKFFETSWYTTGSMSRLLNNSSMLALFAHFLSVCKNVKSDDFAAMQPIPSLEAKLIWNLMCLVRDPAPAISNGTTNGTTPPKENDELLNEASKRLDMFEALILNRNTDANLAQSIHYAQNEQPSPAKSWEIEFWKLLGGFVSLRDDDVSTHREIETILFNCRQYLGQLENRDVLYSIAVARFIGPRIPEFPERVDVYSNEAEDERNKLYVAQKFINDESTRAMSQVVSRVCGMVIRSWHVR
ncbi:hypothetical protein M501DRAFT_1008252 [Patellaria atrata CBS 101060]|uniref:Zn(2)-C6 fungal-type domain-containing protein n=1 Tax=Patellaria atrata CBS 101060 TaxID=1346257 RepID=A0A9P4SG43_9PEZI|nr:hypothetical protein M501DRAFT_1008252 [Patellaria atrata CBS 101060]